MDEALKCPFCGFSGNRGGSGIPPWAKAVVCPRCGGRFPIQGPGDDRPAAVSGKRSERVSVPVDGKVGAGDSPTGGESFGKQAFELLRNPYGFFSRRGDSGDGPGVWASFGLLFGSIGAMLSLFWQFAALALKAAPEAPAVMPAVFGVVFILCAALSPLWAAFSMTVNALLVHLCLRVVGDGREGLRATFRVVAYSQAAGILGIFPVVGIPAAIIWQLVVQVIGLREVHAISSLRLLLSALVPAVFITLVGMVLYVGAYFD